jgi:hypothetical protein
MFALAPMRTVATKHVNRLDLDIFFTVSSKDVSWNELSTCFNGVRHRGAYGGSLAQMRETYPAGEGKAAQLAESD